MNNLKFFDFEVFERWWCCVVSDEEETYPGGLYNNQFDAETEQKIKDKMRIYTSDCPADALALKNDLSVAVISGYNIKRYDLIITKCIFSILCNSMCFNIVSCPFDCVINWIISFYS